MPLIPFPNIPALPGVPQLPRSLAVPVAAILTHISADNFGLFSVTQQPGWGVYDDGGSQVAVADSFVDFEHAKDWRISDYPVEEGAFESYNKVETPYNERVTFAKGGTDADRSDFLDAIAAAVESFDLFSVVTPEVTYVGANLVHYDYRRTSRNGVTLLIVEIGIREVRVTATTTFTKTKSPSGAAQQNGGTVQTQQPSAGQTSAAAGGAG